MWRLRFVIATILTCSVFARAQSQMSSGDVRGAVADATGAVVAGATVSLVHHETGLQRQSATDRNGEWRVFGLPLGQYRLHIETEGFAPHIETIRVGLGQTLGLETRLR